MQINRINQQSFGVSSNEVMIRAAQLAKKQENTVCTKKPSLYAQLLLKDKLFSSDKVSNLVKSDYFSYLINNAKI